MIGALAAGARALKNDIYASQARRAADFILQEMQAEDGTLLHRYRDGEAAVPGFLEDYAFLVEGLLDLFETVHEPVYLQQAEKLNRKMLELFWDETKGGLYFTPAGAEDLPFRTREAFDGAVPSGNSIAARNLIRLAHFTADEHLEQKAYQLMESFSSMLQKSPSNCTAMLSALDLFLGPVQQVVLAGDRQDPETMKMLHALSLRFMPRRIFMLRDEQSAPLLDNLCPYVRDKTPLDDHPAVYLCQNYSCQAPAVGLEELEKQLDR